MSEQDNGIKLVEVKTPQITSEITFPKPITFSDPVTGKRSEDIFDKKNSAEFPESNEESYFINKSGMKDFTVLDEQVDRWAVYRTASEPKKRNWIPVVIGVALVAGLLVGGGTMFTALQSAEKEQLSASVITQEVPETIEEIVATESVEVPIVEESSEVKSFVEDTENIGYGVTYDAERAEQRLDALEALYEQMPERKE